MITTHIKPLSVNDAWKGRRFKTDAYKAYEEHLLLVLPKMLMVPSGKISLTIDAGFSNHNSDIDNLLKPFIDVLQKKYGFNDNNIYKLVVNKFVVKKGSEFIGFEFGGFDESNNPSK